MHLITKEHQWKTYIPLSFILEARDRELIEEFSLGILGVLKESSDKTSGSYWKLGPCRLSLDSNEVSEYSLPLLGIKSSCAVSISMSSLVLSGSLYLTSGFRLSFTVARFLPYFLCILLFVSSKGKFLALCILLSTLSSCKTELHLFTKQPH